MTLSDQPIERRPGTTRLSARDALGRAPWRRWAAVFYRSVHDLWRSNGGEWAAALAFYGLLSIFPLLLVMMLGAAALVDDAWAVEQLTELLRGYLPRGEAEIKRAVEGALARQGGVGWGTAILLLWGGTRVFGVLTNALNLVSDVDERNDSVFRKAAVQGVLLVAVAVLLGGALVSERGLELAGDALDVIPGWEALVSGLVPVLARAGLLLGGFYLVYWLVPRGKRYGRAALVGAVAATLLCLLAQPVFLYYLDRFGRFDEVYGFLAIVSILMVWAWIVGLITLFGGSLASHYKAMQVEGRSGAESADRHQGRPAA